MAQVLSQVLEVRVAMPISKGWPRNLSGHVSGHRGATCIGNSTNMATDMIETISIRQNTTKHKAQLAKQDITTRPQPGHWR